eukprot:c5029_g1_i1 orf=44-247(+)
MLSLLLGLRGDSLMMVNLHMSSMSSDVPSNPHLEQGGVTQHQEENQIITWQRRTTYTCAPPTSHMPS